MSFLEVHTSVYTGLAQVDLLGSQPLVGVVLPRGPAASGGAAVAITSEHRRSSDGDTVISEGITSRSAL